MVIEGAVAIEGRDYKPAAARGGGSSVVPQRLGVPR